MKHYRGGLKRGLLASSLIFTSFINANSIKFDLGYQFGLKGDIAISGNWSGQNTGQIGVYRPSTATFYLDTNSNNLLDAGDLVVSFGNANDLPVIGDWNGDGRSKLGIYRPSTGTFILDVNGNNVLDAADQVVSFGDPGMLPVVGDWNGNGKTKIGIFDSRTATFILDISGSSKRDLSNRVASFGSPGDLPVAGDWNGEGKTRIGIYRPSTSQFLLDTNANFILDSSDKQQSFGLMNDQPVMGNWSSGKVTKIGVARPGMAGLLSVFQDTNGNMLWDSPPMARLPLSAAGTPKNALIGVNIEPIKDWAVSKVFVDVVKQGRGFGDVNSWWVPLPASSLSAEGWPITDFGIGTITRESAINGLYTATFEGQATLSSYSSCPFVVNTVNYDANKNLSTVTFSVSAGQTCLHLKFTKVQGPIKNIHVYRPGYDVGNPPIFTKEFLTALAPFSTVRLMDYLITNKLNGVINWNDRTLMTTQFWSGDKGGPLEAMVDLANQTGKGLWINIPTQASDDYVLGLATLLATRYTSKSPIYLEYSNETWNYLFPQSAYVRQMGTNLLNAGDTTIGLGSQPGLNYVAKRLIEISTIIKSKVNPNLVRPVLASQNANPDFIEWQLKYISTDFGEPSKYIYAISCAPYLMPQGGYAALRTKTQTVDDVVESLKPMQHFAKGINTLKFHAIAGRYGLKSTAYEGGIDIGQDFADKTRFGFSDTEVKTLVATLKDSQLDPTIKAVEDGYMTGWWRGGGDLFMYFNLANKFDANGYYGLTNDITNLTAPKYASTAAFAERDIPYTSAPGALVVPGFVGASGFVHRTHSNGGNLGLADGSVSNIAADREFMYFLDTRQTGNYKLTLQQGAKSTADFTQAILYLDGKRLAPLASDGTTRIYLSFGLHTLSIQFPKGIAQFRSLVVGY